jgi:AsmA-like C-terminal region
MLKVARIASIVILALALVLAACIGLALLNQQRLVAAVVSEVGRRSGVEIAFASSRLEFTSHLVVILEHPRVLWHSREAVAMERLRAVVSYHSIIFTNGLPLYALILVHPNLRIPFDVSRAEIPRLQPAEIRRALELLWKFGAVGRRFQLVGLNLSDEAGRPVVREAGLTAYRKRFSPRLWTVSFDATVARPPLAGMRVVGGFNVGEGGRMPARVALAGHLLYWGIPLDGLQIGNFSFAGKSQGKLIIKLRNNAGIDGSAEASFNGLELRSPELNAPAKLEDLAFESGFAVSADRVTLTKATLRYSGKPIASAEARVDQPYGVNPRIGFEIRGLQVAWSEILKQIGMLRRVPRGLALAKKYLRSGQLKLESASCESSLEGFKKLKREALLRQLKVSAVLAGVGFELPREMEVPAVENASFQLRYANGIVSVTQGSGRLGRSSFSNVKAWADVTRAPEKMPYKVWLGATAELSELKPAVVKALAALRVEQRGRLEALGGRADIRVFAQGDLRDRIMRPPQKYFVRIEPRELTMAFKGTPEPLTVAAGVATVEGDRVALDKVSVRAEGGTVDFDGAVRLDGGGLETRGVTIDVHQMPVEQWLALAVDPADLDARGTMGGELVVKKESKSGIVVDGKLTLSRGTVQFGFLRSPMVTQVATVEMHGRRLVLSMPDARLEGEPIDFKVTVEDLRHPVMRIDAVVQKLDLLVMKFMRLPWMPPTVHYVFKHPVIGHIDARQVRFANLTMSDARADFEYNGGDWRVYNFKAHALQGAIKLELDGRKEDDWIRMKGHVAGMNVARLFLLSDKLGQAPLKGHLDLDADLRADTNEDFLTTMEGKASLKIRDGNLNRFTLLSRLLGFINLKSWLTANVPDPRVVGIPFRVMSATFEGKAGVFHTDDLVVDGPVMDMVAEGDVDVGQSVLAMNIGMVPLTTVSWLLSNIPLVGKNVAGGTGNLLAAYFNVSGPIDDPTVTPAPITSVEKLVTKVLGLPINIIRPNTIK